MSNHRTIVHRHQAPTLTPIFNIERQSSSLFSIKKNTAFANMLYNTIYNLTPMSSTKHLALYLKPPSFHQPTLILAEPNISHQTPTHTHGQHTNVNIYQQHCPLNTIKHQFLQPQSNFLHQTPMFPFRYQCSPSNTIHRYIAYQYRHVLSVKPQCYSSNTIVLQHQHQHLPPRTNVVHLIPTLLFRHQCIPSNINFPPSHTHILHQTPNIHY